MGDVNWWIMDIVGPVVLLVLLAWLAFRWGNRRRGTREDEVSERGTHERYMDEEQRRREGTDGL